jgi:hypothetical protein
MADIRSIHRFLRAEFDAEARAGFARLARVPDTHVRHFLDYYRSLNSQDQDALADASTLWATLRLAPDAGPEYQESLETHTAWSSWRNEMTMGAFRDIRYYSIPSLRVSMAQAKIDRQRGAAASVSKELEDYAASVRSVRAPELRKRVRAAITALFEARPSKIGGGDWEYSGILNGSQVSIGVDYGGRHAQLRYEVDVVSTEPTVRLKRAGFEVALGAGFGDWDFIVEENVDDSMRLLSEFVQYVSELPLRLPRDCFN